MSVDLRIHVRNQYITNAVIWAFGSVNHLVEFANERPEFEAQLIEMITSHNYDPESDPVLWAAMNASYLTYCQKKRAAEDEVASDMSLKNYMAEHCDQVMYDFYTRTAYDMAYFIIHSAESFTVCEEFESDSAYHKAHEFVHRTFSDPFGTMLTEEHIAEIENTYKEQSKWGIDSELVDWLNAHVGENIVASIW